MTVDSSAIVAIVYGEADSDALHDKLITSPSRPIMSAATLLESAIVIEGNKSPEFSRRFDNLLRTYQIEVIPFTQAQAEIARTAFREYGKGSGHPAKLNFGDCIAYALAAETGEPLLCTGDNFIHTDAELA